jgi:hypothetical protein
MTQSRIACVRVCVRVCVCVCVCVCLCVCLCVLCMHVTQPVAGPAPPSEEAQGKKLVAAELSVSQPPAPRVATQPAAVAAAPPAPAVSAPAARASAPATAAAGTVAPAPAAAPKVPVEMSAKMQQLKDFVTIALAKGDVDETDVAALLEKLFSDMKCRSVAALLDLRPDDLVRQ